MDPILSFATWNAAALCVALVADAAIGDPPRLWARIPHPVVLVGRLIAWADARFNAPEASLSDAVRRRRGAGLTVALVAGALVAGAALTAPLRLVPLGWLVEGVLASVLIAQRSLYLHVEAVLDALLGGGLKAGRRAVSHIVGRDPETLDASGVIRAGLESLAENFSDAVVAPAFWYLVGGLPGLMAYKTINTLDSMIGHKTPRHLHFGRAAALLDDRVNHVAARGAGVWIALAARLFKMRRGRPSTRAALAAMGADARKHGSPNAGWSEAAMGGALGVALAGPRVYGARIEDGAWMNETGRREMRTGDLRRGLEIFTRACLVNASCAAAVLAILLAV